MYKKTQGSSSVGQLCPAFPQMAWERPSNPRKLTWTAHSQGPCCHRSPRRMHPCRRVHFRKEAGQAVLLASNNGARLRDVRFLMCWLVHLGEAEACSSLASHITPNPRGVMCE